MEKSNKINKLPPPPFSSENSGINETSTILSFDDKKKHYIQEIQQIAKESFNDEQKQIARFILENATENNIDSIYTFITQRVKTGFVFDAAPEVAHDCVSLCERDDKKSFGSALAPVHHKLIIGENYDVLKNLVATYTKNGQGLIDVIYIDPPYNTEKTKEDGNDYKSDVESSKFVYRDKFSRTGWLNMMKERLELARKLLSDKGVIFISIDDNEQAYLKVLCDEIFGENNFIATIIWQKKKGGSQDSENFSREHEYILCYQKKQWKIIEKEKDFSESSFNKTINGKAAKIVKLEKWGNSALRKDRPTMYYSIKDPNGNDFFPKAPNGEDGRWRKKPEQLDNDNIYWQKDTSGRLIPYEVIYYEEKKRKQKIVKTRTIFTDYGDMIDGTNGFINILDLTPCEMLYFDEKDAKQNGIKSNTIFVKYGTTTDGTNEILSIFNNNKVFETPKPVNLIKKLISVSVNANKASIILDFFGGSGTTAQAVMELNEEDGGNRQCILVTNNENNIATDVTYERLYRVVNGKGTKGESFSWKYSENTPYLTNNYFDVFNTVSYELKIDDYEKSQRLLDKAKQEFKKLNPDYEAGDLDIYNQLASLKPYKK